MTNVHILVTCRGWEHVPMCTLVFDSLRTGFPNAKVWVTINGGPNMDEGASDHIAGELEQDGYQVIRLPREVEHGGFIGGVVYASDDPLVFVDTDVIFWENCEDFPGRVYQYGYLYGGRYVPWITPAPGVESPPRIHPSLFVVPDPVALRKKLAPTTRRWWHFKPFDAYGVVDHLRGTTICHDTCSSLYAALPMEAYKFGENELDRYDHLFAGTYPDRFGEMGMDKGLAASLLATHEIAKTNPAALRGLWRKQEGLE